MGTRSIVTTAAIVAAAAGGGVASGADFLPRDIHGAKVGNTVLWAHVFHRAKPAPVQFACFDIDTSTAEPAPFTEPNASGITFRPAPGFETQWGHTLASSFATWNDAADFTAFAEFGDTAAGTMARPSNRADGVNYMGFASLGGRTLAVTYTWSQGGAVVETDMFFNSKVTWQALTYDAFATCPTGTAYDMESIATHELGHSLGFDHITDVAAATMYPTAPAGETRKRTLTAGETTAAVGAFLP